MKAMMVEALSDDIGALKLVDVPTPEPGPGDVRVRVRACAVNFPDLLMVQGKYQFKPDLPFSPGMEGSGIVDAVGAGVTDWHEGDEVCFGNRFGGFAEYIVVPASTLRSKPEGLDFAEASAYRTAYLTAHVALYRRGNLQPGEVALIHGAAGGVGMAAVDVAKMMGATVIATGGSDDKLAVVRDYGADHVINYTQADGTLGGFREQVKALTDGRGADVIYDPVGGDVFDESVRCINWGGRLLVIGFAGGRIPSINANMPLIKGFSVVGVRAGEFGRRDPERGRENLETVDGWAQDGRIKPYIHASYPLEEAVAAMRELENRTVVGKVVITPWEE